MTSLTPLNIKIISPQATLYTGPAESVTSYNMQGRFDILPQHSHFISEIKENIIIVNSGEEKTFKFNKGIIRCWDNDIQVYIVQ